MRLDEISEEGDYLCKGCKEEDETVDNCGLQGENWKENSSRDLYEIADVDIEKLCPVMEMSKNIEKWKV